MINKTALPSHITVYSSKAQEIEFPFIIKVIRWPFIPLVYLIFKDKIVGFKNTIKALTESNTNKTNNIESLKRQIEEYKEQINKPELIAEQTKRLVKTGNRVKLEETKTCEGDYRFLNEFMSSGGW